MPHDADTIFRQRPFMGVIRVNVAAMEHGYAMGHPDWCNLGQGQPEVGDMAGAPPRCDRLSIAPEDHAYGAIEGVPELREAIAEHYNRLYRRDRASKYTAENVAVAAGGRLALSRCAATLDVTRLGHFTPDYTAYEDLLVAFPQITPSVIELPAERGFTIDPDELEARVTAGGLDALLISNPCNPTGVVIRGDALAAWVDLARRRRVTLLLDEFYSHFIYDGDGDGPARPARGPVSAAAHVEDVDRDPVVIVDGLTKCFRYPGWRVGWVVAPRHVIHAMSSTGSFLDGGPPRPMQRAAIEILQPARADQETEALRAAFCAKRNLVVRRLEALGVTFPAAPAGTFYAFGSIAALPAPLDGGEAFMRAGFAHRVLTVPGAYFDVNPRAARPGPSALDGFVRFSYGPSIDVVRTGLDRIEAMLAAGRR